MVFNHMDGLKKESCWCGILAHLSDPLQVKALQWAKPHIKMFIRIRFM